LNATCHKTDVNNKWHHNSDLGASGQCTACHRPDLVGGLRGTAPAAYYPNGAAPTPFRCENCHWGSTVPEPDVFNPMDTHHMSFWGDVSAACYDCHSMSPNSPNWDPLKPTLIRFCANCHTRDSLHAVAAHQVSGRCYGCHGANMLNMPTPTPRPPAVGLIDSLDGTIFMSGNNFGAPGPGSSVVLIPRVGDATGSRAPTVIPSTDPSVFCWNDMLISVLKPLGSPPGNYDVEVQTTVGISNRTLCILSGAAAAPPVPGTPAITSLSPTIGAEGVLVTLEGSSFGDRHCCDREVYGRDVSEWDTALPIHSWTDTKIVVRMPAWTFQPGVVSLHVHNESGDSGLVDLNFRQVAAVSGLSLNGQALTISGTKFGSLQEEVLPDNYGYSSRVKLGTREHTYTATNITSWSDTQIDLTLNAFVNEGGTPVSALANGQYGLMVETTYFYDTNTSGGLDPGDDVHQVVMDGPAELLLGDTGIPKITAVIPAPAEAGAMASVIGYHFGSSKGKVRMGTYILKPNDSRIRYWSDTRVNYIVKPFTAWESGTCKNVGVKIIRKNGPGSWTPSDKFSFTVCKP
jgi:hypothetical protein